MGNKGGKVLKGAGDKAQSNKKARKKWLKMFR